MSSIVENIRRGEIDINNQDLFFSILIKGLILNLNKDITIRKKGVPHFILHTGDDIMYQENRDYNNSLEPMEVSNENYIYNQIPRCIVEPSNVDLSTDQLTNPYSRGVFQYDSGDQLMTLSAEFRRIPLKMTCDLKYYVDSFTDSMELIQQVISKLCFIKTYYITYMGQTILCSYQIPTSFQEERLMDIDGTTTDNKNKVLNMSIEIETSYPVFEHRTVVSTSNIITTLDKTVNLNDNLATVSKFYSATPEKKIELISTGDLIISDDTKLKYNKNHEIG